MRNNNDWEVKVYVDQISQGENLLQKHDVPAISKYSWLLKGKDITFLIFLGKANVYVWKLILSPSPKARFLACLSNYPGRWT